MKRTISILAIIVALIVGAVGIGWVYFRLNPAAWDEFVAQIQGETTTGTAPRPVRRPAGKTGGLVASGTIEAEEVMITAEIGGRIVAVLAGEGNRVAEGDVLVRLDPTLLQPQREQAEAAVAQAQAALDAAHAQLALARAGARPEEIAMAEGAVAGAQAGLEAAQGQLAVTEADPAAAQGQLSAAKVAQTNAEALVTAAQAGLDGAKAQLSAAQAELAAAQAQLRLAQARLAYLEAGARAEEIAAAEANLRAARATLDGARQAYDPFAWQPGVDVSPIGVAYRQAQAAVDAAQAQVDLLKAGATEEELAQVQAAEDAAGAAVAAGRAAVELAQAGVDGAEAQLTQAQVGVEAAGIQVTQAQVAVEAAQAAVIIAQAGIDAAQAQLDQAQASLDLLKAGARNEEIALLEANVAQAEAALGGAEAALKALDAQLERMTLTAPLSGVVVERLVCPGELAAPGAPLLTLANLDEVTLTVYVPEADLGQVALGQTVEVTVDAYEDTFTGQVSHIASRAEFTPRNVQTQEERVHMVFAVKIRLGNTDGRLKPGMPADAAFQ